MSLVCALNWIRSLALLFCVPVASQAFNFQCTAKILLKFGCFARVQLRSLFNGEAERLAVASRHDGTYVL